MGATEGGTQNNNYKMKWRDLSGMPRELKTKLYMAVIRMVLLYGAEYWTDGKKEEQILEKTQMRMLRRIKGVTLRDKECGHQ